MPSLGKIARRRFLVGSAANTGGVSQQRNYHAYGSLRLWRTPDVEVRAPGTTGKIRGAGEPGLPAAASAHAAAIFAATGPRLRELPFARHLAFA